MSRRLSFLFAALLALGLAAPVATAAPPPEDARSAHVPGAAALEARLVAPCCWVQTLDGHESELAAALRAEIRRRLQAGEKATAIEDDLAARYGERIRAVEKGGDTRAVVPIVAAVASLAGALGFLSWMLRRTRRAPAEPAVPAESPGAPDIYDERLDDELRRLDS